MGICTQGKDKELDIEEKNDSVDTFSSHEEDYFNIETERKLQRAESVAKHKTKATAMDNTNNKNKNNKFLNISSKNPPKKQIPTPSKFQTKSQDLISPTHERAESVHVYEKTQVSLLEEYAEENKEGNSASVSSYSSYSGSYTSKSKSKSVGTSRDTNNIFRGGTWGIDNKSNSDLDIYKIEDLNNSVGNKLPDNKLSDSKLSDNKLPIPTITPPTPENENIYCNFVSKKTMQKADNLLHKRDEAAKVEGSHISSFQHSRIAIDSIKYLGLIDSGHKPVKQKNDKDVGRADGGQTKSPNTIKKIEFNQMQKITHLDILEREQFYDSEEDYGLKDALDKEVNIKAILFLVSNMQTRCSLLFEQFDSEINRIKKRLKKVMHLVNEILA